MNMVGQHALASHFLFRWDRKARSVRTLKPVLLSLIALEFTLQRWMFL